MTDYISKSGDMLDAIAYQYYGTEQAVVEILDANPGLVDQPVLLPAGVWMTLPDIPKPEQAGVALWD